jgi:hypothetical protein
MGQRITVALSSLAIALAIALAACAPQVGTHAEVPKDSVSRCTNMCQEIGLPLEAVVIQSSNIACSCAVTKPATTATSLRDLRR